MVSKWQKLLSYFYDIPLESVQGRDGVVLHVGLSKGEYQLFTDHAIYSYGKRYANFYKLFKKLDIPNNPPRSVLLLGLGLGSIPLMLESDFGIACDYTAVEYDDEVIALASKYVLNTLKSPVSVVQADASFYVKHCDAQFDLICIDIFVDDVIPPAFQSISFLKDVEKLLESGGTLVFNRLYRDPQSKGETKRYFHTVFQSVFPNGKYRIIDLNAMLVANKEPASEQ